MRAADGRLVTVNATGCLEVFSTPYPGVLLAGAVAALAVRQRRRPSRRVWPRRCRRRAGTTSGLSRQGGDGGTVDIGFACLSGMFERNDDVLYVCYDNQAYMNTGVQRSGATPPAARTSTTPAVGPDPGNAVRARQGRAADRDGARHPVRRHRDRRRPARPRGTRSSRRCRCMARATCTCWCPARSAGATASDETVRLARLATQSGLFPVFEAEHGEVVAVTPIRRHEPGRGLPAGAEALRPPVRPPSGATTSIDRIQEQRRPEHRPLRAARPTRRCTHERPAVRHLARRRPRAWPTTPVPGACSARCTST